MFNLRYFIHILCIASIFLLTQCTKITSHTPFNTHPALNSPFTLPAAAYLALAKKQTGREHQSLLIMAAGRLIEEGQWQEGLHVLSQTGPVTDDLLYEKNILLAKTDIMQLKPHDAIRQLAQVQDVTSLSVYYQAQFHELLAQAYQAVHQLQDAIKERIILQTVLPDASLKNNNARVIWLLLAKLPPNELNAWAIELNPHSVLTGWIKLTLIAHNSSLTAHNILSQLQQWQHDFPQHPAQALLPSSLDQMASRVTPAPQHVALLLPLSGPLAGPGQAVRDGFMSAYEASGQNGVVKVQLYDTASTSNIQSLYEQAVHDGAEYIVGPLSKPDVAAVAAMPHPVRTLLLNDVTSPISDQNAYVFGLSPRNEARQVAAHARKQGYHKALIIAPSGAWGDEISAVFTQQWQSNGGQVIDTLHYMPHDDLNKSLRDFLHVTRSEGREKQLQMILGSDLESTPARRQDFDVIFLLAYPSTARQIMPLLKYYYVADVPVFATSSVYSGNMNTMKDRDLDHIIFADMPWVFHHNLTNHNWPEPLNSYNRLYALGIDSYMLTQQLNQLLLFPALGIQDQSGILYLNAQQHITPILTFGEFKNGVIELKN